MKTKSGNKNLIIGKEGAGRLYYRIGMTYAPTSLMSAALDRGFKVQRQYEAVKNKDDVKQDSDGRWHFKAGSLVRVRLKMSSPAERFFVALVDPLPAGGEALNEELQGAETVTDKAEQKHTNWNWWWQWNWYTHQNKRDQQVEVFADNISSGAYDYSYVMRATTPGVFVVPPTKAEEMYAPETFGRARSETVVVE